ncbi:uncharacterized protein LOC130665898 [Microplitis mediator]|uniref:uncharacterized protein LOC130665898 n=1 Tax=Microplitis mediator TaxID=375433 RepID=UPI002556C55C|nr:uncharacterized protein LOC130665898 [Microplitis mediator]
MWGGIVGNVVILHPLPDAMNGANYLTFLQEVLPEALAQLPPDERPQWFQHDGAPTHTAAQVTEYLNATYPNSWIGRNGPFPWPPRSPDLTPLDFFLWGYMKGVVYETEPEDQFETMARIQVAYLNITPDMMEKVRTDLIRRCRLCIQVGGGTFEQLL